VESTFSAARTLRLLRLSTQIFYLTFSWVRRMGEHFRLIVWRIDLMLLRALQVAAPRAVLLVFPLLVLPGFSLGFLIFLLSIPGILEVVLLKHQKNIWSGLALVCTCRGCRKFPSSHRLVMRFDPDNAHAWGLSIHGAYMGSGKLDGGR
jgi:hypothetical protein